MAKGNIEQRKKEPKMEKRKKRGGGEKWKE